MKHTPGPWRTPAINYADIYSEPANELVALAIKGLDGTVANAQLIAAAPDLLEALKAQSAYAARNPTPWGHDCRWCGDCCARLLKMRDAAIAKAEGRQ